MPVAGGLYDQHPDFLEKMAYINTELQKENQRKEAAKKRAKMGPSPRNT